MPGTAGNGQAPGLGGSPGCLVEQLQDAQCRWSTEAKGDQAGGRREQAAQGTPSGDRSGLVFAQKQ